MVQDKNLLDRIILKQKFLEDNKLFNPKQYFSRQDPFKIEKFSNSKKIEGIDFFLNLNLQELA